MRNRSPSQMQITLLRLGKNTHIPPPLFLKENTTNKQRISDRKIRWLPLVQHKNPVQHIFKLLKLCFRVHRLTFCQSASPSLLLYYITELLNIKSKGWGGRVGGGGDWEGGGEHDNMAGILKYISLFLSPSNKKIWVSTLKTDQDWNRCKVSCFCLHLSGLKTVKTICGMASLTAIP